jgi:drug/metabolite transporter (DMT)-like permease
MFTLREGVHGAVPSGSANARGIAAMLFSMACFVTSDTLIKIVGRDMPVGQIMFMRGFLAFLMVGIAILAKGLVPQIKPAMTPIVAWRSIVEVGATVFFFTGLMRLPFADAAAIGQFTPLAVTAGAALFLAEPVGWRRWLATAVGLIGVLMIIQPGTSAFNPAAILIVICVFFVAARDLITKQMGNGVPILVLIFISASAVALTGLFGLAIESWIWPTRVMIIGLLASALGVTGGYYGAIVAMRSGEISVVAPFRYAAMLFALMWGYVIFGEIPDRTTWVGIAIVVAAGVYTFHRESVRKRELAAVVKAAA